MARRLIHLDTNFLIAASVEASGSRSKVRDWIAEGTELGISAMAWAEFVCGPVEADVVAYWEQALGSAIVAVDRTIAERAAHLFNHSGRRGRSLPDCLIAACAIEWRARIATLNPRDFTVFVPHGLVLA